jgi:acetyl-CoA/propionyl-CoA carboxylase biotin carboxyl carrier protein
VRQEDVTLRGHAIECRINAEDPAKGFLPSPGRITSYREPSGPGVRVDSGVGVGSEISGLYDPMVAKLIVHDTDRESARRRMLRALGEFEIGGIASLLGFHQALLGHPCFIAGETCHGLVESELLAEQASRFSQPTTGQSVASNGAMTERVAVAEIDGRRVEVRLLVAEPGYRELARRRRQRAASGALGDGSGVVASPMQGTVLDVKVVVGDQVAAGQVVCIVEAMKMENEVAAPWAGTVTDVAVEAGAPVTTGQPICVISPA